MFKKLTVLACTSVWLAFASLTHAADVKVMRAYGLVEKGENCKLTDEADAWNNKSILSTTLKKMSQDGWKIVYVKELPTRLDTEFMLIFTKD